MRFRFSSALTPTRRQSVALAMSSRHVGGNAGPNLNLPNAIYLINPPFQRALTVSVSFLVDTDYKVSWEDLVLQTICVCLDLDGDLCRGNPLNVEPLNKRQVTSARQGVSECDPSESSLYDSQPSPYKKLSFSHPHLPMQGQTHTQRGAPSHWSRLPPPKTLRQYQSPPLRLTDSSDCW